MPALSLPGVNLDYDTTGAGPHLVLIAGAPGNSTVFRKTIGPLSKHFTVTVYSRRGFSKSHLVGAQDYSKRLETDADDAAALIRHVTGGESAYVFGTSAGAIVAQQLLLRQPETVRMCVSHEPPSLAVVPNRAEAAGFFEQVLYPLYRAQGPEPALALFFSVASSDDERACWEVMSCRPDASAEMRGDVNSFFERELLDYPNSELDVEALKDQKDKFVGCVGHFSRGKPGGAPIEGIAELLDCKLVETMGGHIGYYTHPEEFAETMKAVFS